MTHEEYVRNQRVIFLYASTITCTIIGLSLYFERLVFVSSVISHFLSFLFILASYFLFLKIAARLKKKEIHGITAIVWASLLLFLCRATGTTSYIWVSVLQAVTTVLLIYFMVDGIIRFVISLVMVIKRVISSEQKMIDSIDTVVAVLTSLIAIIISFIEIC